MSTSKTTSPDGLSVPPAKPPEEPGTPDKRHDLPATVQRPSALLERMRRVNPNMAKQYQQKPGQ